MTASIQMDTGLVSTVTIGEPHSLGTPLLQSLLTILTGGIDPAARVLVITTSHPEALLADVAALRGMSPTDAFAFSELGQKVCAAIEALPFPVIAAVDGLALGGGRELTLASDLVYASKQSQFGQIEVRGGVIPGFGGTWRLGRRVGDLKARALLYTGAILDAQNAKATALVTDVFAGSELLDKVNAIATAIARSAPLAVRAAKTMVLTNQSISLKASDTLERQIFASLFGTADQKEGMGAFLEKRTATFVGA